jgi:hypothetical protein
MPRLFNIAHFAKRDSRGKIVRELVGRDAATPKWLHRDGQRRGRSTPLSNAWGALAARDKDPGCAAAHETSQLVAVLWGRLSDSSPEATAKALDFGAVTARFHIAPAPHPVAAVIDK